MTLNDIRRYLTAFLAADEEVLGVEVVAVCVIVASLPTEIIKRHENVVIASQIMIHRTYIAFELW